MAWQRLPEMVQFQVVEIMVDIEWEEHGIDCMKINISLPNLARIKVWKYAYENSYYFTTFGKNNVEEEQKQ